jgi:hypothetical protein
LLLNCVIAGSVLLGENNTFCGTAHALLHAMTESQIDNSCLMV